MQTNNHKISNYDDVLDIKYGKEGTEQRAKFEEKAKAYYASQILLQARKEASYFVYLILIDDTQVYHINE